MKFSLFSYFLMDCLYSQDNCTIFKFWYNINSVAKSFKRVEFLPIKLYLKWVTKCSMSSFYHCHWQNTHSNFKSCKISKSFVVISFCCVLNSFYVIWFYLDILIKWLCQVTIEQKLFYLNFHFKTVLILLSAVSIFK